MASFQIEWKRSAVKELEKLPKQVISKALTTVDDLSNDPFPHGVRKLVGSEHSYRVRLGEYRIVYDVFQSRLLIEIIRVRHRKDAYK